MKKKKEFNIFLITLFSIFSSVACQSRFNQSDKTHVSSLISKNSEKRQKIDFKLRFAEVNQIQHQSFEVTAETSKKDDNFINPLKTKKLEIYFGKVTQDQYELLMKRYGGQNLVPFDENKEYELTDFLPPKIQAFNNKYLIDSWTPEPGLPAVLMDPRDALEGTTVPLTSTSMNCWAMAYEVLRDFKLPFSSQKAQIGMFMNGSAHDVFVENKNNKYLKQIKSLPLDKLAASLLTQTERNKNLQFMDALVLTFEGITGPAHVALWIDEDLYFEKTNSGGDEPIRLSTYTQVVDPFLPDPASGLAAQVLFKRMTTETLPSLESFSDKHAFDSELTKEIPQNMAKKFIYEQTASAGGGLGRIIITKIHNFKLAQDPVTKRAMIPDAEKLVSFYSGDTLCRIGVSTLTGDFGKFIYKLDRNFFLSVFQNNNGAEGREVARIPGRFTDGKEAINGELNWFEFASGDNILRIYSKRSELSTSSQYFLDHPGVKTDIPIGVEGNFDTSGCVRSPKDLHKV